MSVTTSKGVGIFSGITLWKFDDGTVLRSDTWEPFASRGGLTIYHFRADAGDTQYPYVIPWLRKDGKVQAFHTALQFEVQNFLKDPVAWAQGQEERAIAAAAKSSPFHSIIKSVTKAVGDVGSALVKLDKDVYGTVLHPLTIDNGGLALSHQTTAALSHAGASDSLIDAAQTVTKFAGYGVVAAAAGTALAGSSLVDSAAGSIETFGSTAIDAAKTAVGIVGAVQGGISTVKGLLGATPTVSDTYPTPLKPSTFPIGPAVAIGVVGLALILGLAGKG